MPKAVQWMVTDLGLELASSWLAMAPVLCWTVLPSRWVWSCMLLALEFSQPENLVFLLQGKICCTVKIFPFAILFFFNCYFGFSADPPSPPRITQLVIKDTLSFMHYLKSP